MQAAVPSAASKVAASASTRLKAGLGKDPQSSRGLLLEHPGSALRWYRPMQSLSSMHHRPQQFHSAHLLPQPLQPHPQFPKQQHVGEQLLRL